MNEVHAVADTANSIEDRVVEHPRGPVRGKENRNGCDHRKGEIERLERRQGQREDAEREHDLGQEANAEDLVFAKAMAAMMPAMNTGNWQTGFTKDQ